MLPFTIHLMRCLYLEQPNSAWKPKELNDCLLEIYSKPIESLARGVKVHTYDDRHVAKAFFARARLLGVTIPEEKRRVEKT